MTLFGKHKELPERDMVEHCNRNPKTG
uniref:Uncharacterized protein n=1 Tax=Rhizophora mucronata TaxID=61149 RepID=A0A2P2NZM9_RHIMU